MCQCHLTKEEATELIQEAIDLVDGALPANGMDEYGKAVACASAVQKLLKLRDGYIDVH